MSPEQIDALIQAAANYAYRRSMHGPRSWDASHAADTLYSLVKNTVPNWNHPFGPGGQHGYSGIQPSMPRPAPDRPQLAACTRCGARPTFYGVCCICDRAARELRAATTFQTVRLRDGVFDRTGE